MTDVMSPVSVESAIRECSNRISRGVAVVSERYKAYLTADRDYDHAYAAAFLSYEGPQTEKKYAAVLNTTAEREARDIADARALEDELRALQSVNKSVMGMYSAAGKGES